MSIAEVMYALVLLCEAGMCFLLFEAWLERRAKMRGWMIGTAVLLLALCFDMMQGWSDDIGAKSIGMVMTAFVISLLCYQGVWYKHILAVLSAFAVMAGSVLISVRMVMGVFYLSQEQVETMTSYRLLSIILAMGLGVAVCNAVRIKRTVCTTSGDAVFWWWFVVLMAIAIILCFLLFWMSAQIMPLSFNALAVAGAVGVFFSAFTTMTLYERLAKQKDAVRRQVQRTQALNNQIKYLDEMAVKQQALRRFKHDLSNQFLVLNDYLNRKDVDGAQAYLCSLTQDFETMIPLVDTGNAALDTILTSKKTLAESKGIEFDMKVQVPLALAVAPMDVAAILGNALDNAIEACERIGEGARWIELSLVQQESALLCKIVNSAPQGTLTLQTTKDDAINHGFGLDSIKATLAKYDTLPLIEQADGQFSLSFVIYC